MSVAVDARGTAAGYAAEREKWDAHVRLFAGDLLTPHADFAAYARTMGTLVGVPELLGDLSGKRLLEFGCGSGTAAVALARSGARVSAFDLSAASVAVARRRAEANGVTVNVVEAAAERLPYPDESFDVVFGKAVLHHLDVSTARAELLRVLKPGGQAVFSEPLGTNRLLELARGRVRYPGKTPRGIDRPLTYADLREWSQGFREFRFREIQLFAMLERLARYRGTFRPFTRADAVVLERLPALRRFCRYVLIDATK